MTARANALWVTKRPYYSFAAIQAEQWQAWRREFVAGLGHLPFYWRRHAESEMERRGGVESEAARGWFAGIAAAARGRLSLGASDDEIRAAAKAAAAEGADIAALAKVRGGAALLAVLAEHCRSWGIEPAKVRDSGAASEVITHNEKLGFSGFHRKNSGQKPENGKFSVRCNQGVEPAIKRMLCARWWLRRLRRAHGRRCEGAAINAGVIRRGLWPYASQDCVARRTAQRRRNARALDAAVVECDETGESLKLADVVAGSVANPEVKRGELMVRVKGCDAIANEAGHVAEFWTLTAPSRFHSQRIIGATAEPNPAYEGATPKEAQGYLCKVWARARAAWKRRGLEVFGLRTAEPHHDACPHWHLIAYGPARDLRYARRLLRVYALRDTPDEPGARRHRFVVLKAKGAKGAAYAAKYVSKNINGAGMEGERDGETGRAVSSTAVRVDAWAAAWGIRQFQFFGCPKVSIWRTLRRLREPVAVAGAALEEARAAADRADFAGFWRAVRAGDLRLLWRPADALTAYGDAAAARIAGVVEGGRRALLPVKKWVIRWAGAAKNAAGVAFDLPRSCVNNCTRAWFDWYADAAGAVFSIVGDNRTAASP